MHVGGGVRLRRCAASLAVPRKDLPSRSSPVDRGSWRSASAATPPRRDSLRMEYRAKAGGPNWCQLEPNRRLASANRRASARGVNVCWHRARAPMRPNCLTCRVPCRTWPCSPGISRELLWAPFSHYVWEVSMKVRLAVSCLCGMVLLPTLAHAQSIEVGPSVAIACRGSE